MMTSLLDGLIDPRFIPAVTWLIIGVIALIVVYTAYRIVRMLTSGTYIAGGRNRRTRLAVLDAAAVDDRRRLVLVRRDDVEHLILIGGPTDVVVEQDIRIGVRPTRTVAADPDQALDAYDHGDQALQPHPSLPVQPRQPRQPNRAVERPQAERAPAPTRPVRVEPAPAAPAPQPVAAPPMAPVATLPKRQHLAPVESQPPVPAAPQQRSVRPVMPRVTLPAASQPDFVQPAEEQRDPPMTARVTPYPARSQMNRRAQQQTQPQPAAVENDLDDALLQELETSLRYPARERTRSKAADIDDEMNKLLGEMSRDRP